MFGLVHIYCGKGKGKSTAALGLTLRAAGAGRRVLFVQFFKDGSSSEIGPLRAVEGVEVLCCPTHHGLFSNMDEAAQRAAAADYGALLETALERARSGGFGLLVLDEALSACQHRIIDEALLLSFLQNRPEGLEVVLTGREPSEALLSLADYVTEMRKIKHPFTRGVPARRGIEF